MNVRRKILFYRTVDGKCPVADFLDSLPGKDAQKIAWVLKLLEELDRIPIIYFKKLEGTDGLWECRIQFGSNYYRILCFFINNSTIVLTNGFIKKGKKTPKIEIEKGDVYRRDFLRRRIKHE
jgi:phage-related protein